MNKTVNLDHVLNEIISHAKTAKTTDIIKGISDRLVTRGTITPKQACWILDQITINNTVLQDIYTVTEKKTSLPDQEWALKRLIELVNTREQAAQDHYDRLFVIQNLERIDTALQDIYTHLNYNATTKK